MEGQIALPGSPVVGVAAQADVAAWDADVVEMALVKAADIARINFNWIAILVSHLAVKDSRDDWIASVSKVRLNGKDRWSRMNLRNVSAYMACWFYEDRRSRLLKLGWLRSIVPTAEELGFAIA